MKLIINKSTFNIFKHYPFNNKIMYNTDYNEELFYGMNITDFINDNNIVSQDITNDSNTMNNFINYSLIFFSNVFFALLR